MPTLDTPDVPFGFEAIYAVPKHRRLKQGDIYTVTLEVDRATWDAFIAANPANSYAVLMSKVDYDAKNEPAPPERKDKGDFGWIAQAIYRAGIPDVLPVRAALGIAHDATTEQAFAAIREHVASYWEQSSSTFVDVDGWRKWSESVGIGKYIVPVLAQKEREG